MDALGQLTAALAGRYTIERELGAGGMATVYLAHDVRHDRRVALKLLRPELAAVIGAERFLREIRTTANLQHPHILPLFDSGEAGSQLFYVMPLAEGESLRDRLDREKQLGVEESVRIATEVASALDYAHRHGVVHRDVKPANILLHDGSALVTDFGIALAVRNAGADRITETGLSLGTPHYMSPEQATGDRDIGARSDVYSLAAVLYEMLAGEPPHSGGTIQAVIAKVLTEVPRPLGGLRGSVPVHVALAVEQALAKVPADRFATAAEFAEALRNPAVTSTRSRATIAAHIAPRARPSWQIGALAAGTLALGALGGWLLRQPAPPEAVAVVRFEVSPDSGARLQDRPALSPDGSLIVYSAVSESGAALYLRRFDEVVARRLAGTEGAEGPFFSPDGKSIGFVSNYQLRTLRLDGGAPVNVARVGTFFLGATWTPDNTILFTQFPAFGIYRVSASGGTVDRIPLADSSATPFSPAMIPDGRGVLLTVVTSSGPTLAVLDLRDNSLRRLGPGLGPQFVPPHWLVFATGDGQLYRQRFDPAAMDTIGSREPVLSGVRVDNSMVLPIFAVAHNGSVASLSSGTALSSLMLVDRSGDDQELFAGDQVWAPRFSPDGRRLAYGEIANGKQESDVWIRDLGSGTSQRLTLEGNDGNDPVWSQDGKSILYSSNEDRSVKDLFIRSVDGVGGARPVLRRADTQWNSDWSRDGKVVLFTDLASDTTGWNIWSVQLDDSASAKPYLMTPFQETGGRLSPDGKWITYHSNETGRNEVYVQSFPSPGHKTVISTEGGRDGAWSSDGRVIYYWRSVDLMMATVTTTNGSVSVGKRERLFQYPAYLTGAHANYDVSPDGRSFAIVSGGPTANRLTVALNLIR